ncbi:hypothetical protein [Burkholderia lata]|uniref:hypothetical protein n=1 Tax=Burkholderia lata (strain ATCC 17760 / DSM 23089 / LMG 22485 / NCIMB 9086 / R18194 / 383) TaxID=482957 RepID=UPI0014532155|nr:hypothetical protein [Burkholderia lata]VWB38455.1 integrase catalytic subunit [Burkholderia lata]
MYFRQKISQREIVVRTGVFRRTMRAWRGQTDLRSRKHPQRAGPRVLDAWTHKLSGRFKTESRRPKREQCAPRIVFDTIRAQGNAGVFDLSRRSLLARVVVLDMVEDHESRAQYKKDSGNERDCDK